ncbi:MAG: hypothetical protein IT565_11820 [Rhodospirillales bacterium]|nr:hypothetical protein [Rhodospirillales bacterium]
MKRKDRKEGAKIAVIGLSAFQPRNHALDAILHAEAMEVQHEAQFVSPKTQIGQKLSQMHGVNFLNRLNL